MVIVEVICFHIGEYFATIRKITVKYQILFELQNQLVQQVIQELVVCHLSEMLLCISKGQVVITAMKEFLLVGKELILYKLLI